MKMVFDMKKLCIRASSLFFLLYVFGCGAENKKLPTDNQCRSYVDLYLSFHEVMANGEFSEKKVMFSKSFHIHPINAKNTESLKSLIVNYTEHEADIQKIYEYSVSCNSEKHYASMWFKIADADPRFSRLYVVVDAGKIETLSKEMASSADKIDAGKNYHIL
jgi:hypothetical protein